MRKEQRKLKNFLRSKGLLTRFKLNIRNDKSYHSDINFSRGNLYIGSAFVWECTPEGHKFWMDLQDEFHKTL